MPFLEDFLASFVLLFFVMDPFASIPLFISLTRRFGESQRLKSADNAVVVAGLLALAFLFFGTAILNAFRVSLASFKVFGGFVLALLALEIVFGIHFSREKAKDLHIATVIIATPMLTGPGVISTVIILANQFGHAVTLAATLAALLASWLVLRNSFLLQRQMGENTLEIASKVIGLLLGAVGVEFMRSGLAG